MELADIQFLSDFTYYTYQRDLIIPVINEHAKISAQNLIEKVKLNGKLNQAFSKHLGWIDCQF